MEILAIPKEQTYEWLLNKHYAKIIPSVMLSSYGLFIDGKLCGVCTFSPPARNFNNGDNLFKNYAVKTIELNRLCVADNLPKNSLSRFIAGVLNMLDKPCAVLSYSDSNAGHHGYIYQATNFLYLGETNDRNSFHCNGKQIHERQIVHMYGTSALQSLPPNITVKKQLPKHRYLYLLGSKTQKKEMIKNLQYPVLPYPKGNNQRYDSSYTPSVQALLF